MFGIGSLDKQRGHCGSRAVTGRGSGSSVYHFARSSDGRTSGAASKLVKNCRRSIVLPRFDPAASAFEFGVNRGDAAVAQADGVGEACGDVARAVLDVCLPVALKLLIGHQADQSVEVLAVVAVQCGRQGSCHSDT